MVLHLNYKTTHSSSVIQRRNSLSGELHSKILTNSHKEFIMKNIKIMNFLIILTLVSLSFSQSQSQSFDLKSLPDAYEEFNYNLGGQIFAASQIGEDSLIIGSYKQSPLYFYDVKNNNTV